MAYDITQLGSALEFDTTDTTWGIYNSSVQIDDTHVMNFWAGSGNDGYTQIFEINTSTGDIIPLGSALEFDTSNGIFHSCVKIDDTHVMNFWRGNDADGFTQIFEINTSTGSITPLGSALEFDTSDGHHNSCVKIDDTHVMNFWTGNDGRTQIFEINTSTGDITPLGSALEFDTIYGSFNSCVKIDDTHVMNFWAGSGYDGYTQVFEINTSTGDITPLGSALEFDTIKGTYNSCVKIDNTHVMNFWTGNDSDGFTQIFEINTSTGAITPLGSALEFDTISASYNSCVKIDDTHVMNFWTGFGFYGYTQIFEINIPSTFTPYVMLI